MVRKLVSWLFGDKLETTVVHCDNQRCIKLTENPIFHDRSKHIDMRCHYIRDLVQRKTVKLQYIASVKFGNIDSHSPMRGHMGHPEASQGDLENQPVL
jgi:hypothetical protein